MATMQPDFFALPTDDDTPQESWYIGTCTQCHKTSRQRKASLALYGPLAYAPCPQQCTWQGKAVHVEYRAIAGTYKAGRKCDSRCTHAKGHDCECSCSGKNHGMDA